MVPTTAQRASEVHDVADGRPEVRAREAQAAL